MAGKGKRGPARMKLGKPQLDEVVGAIEKGHGRIRACLMAGISYKTFARRMAEDEDLRERVLGLELARSEDCTKVIYDLKDHADPEVALAACKAFLAQQAKIREARDARRAAKQSQGQAEDLAAILGRIADAIWEFVMPEKRDEMIARLEALEKEIEAA